MLYYCPYNHKNILIENFTKTINFIIQMVKTFIKIKNVPLLHPKRIRGKRTERRKILKIKSKKKKKYPK